MKTFITNDFLLRTDAARELYHNYAEGLPIIDYHCHLIPQQIAENKKFDNITQVWLYGDHYKWRAMRANGINERFITGDATDKEKFQAWAQTVPNAVRNPLYHWTHLELLRYFGIDDLLNPDSADDIYARTAELLQQDDYRVWGLLKKMNVETVCTTDDPVDSLEYHIKLKDSECPFKVLPAWRPDKAMNARDPKKYNEYIDRLAAAADMDINSFDALFDALDKRIEFFHSVGCRVADFGLDYLYSTPCSDADAKKLFLKVRSGKALEGMELPKFQSAVLYRFALQVSRMGWVQ